MRLFYSRVLPGVILSGAAWGPVNLQGSWGKRSEGSASYAIREVARYGNHGSLRSSQVAFASSIKSDFSDPGPSFDFLFALDCGADFAESLKPDETVAVVSCGESGVGLLLVLEDASAQVAGDTDVEGSASAGEDVCEVEALVHWWNGNETAGDGKCLRSRQSARSRSFAPPHREDLSMGTPCLPHERYAFTGPQAAPLRMTRAGVGWWFPRSQTRDPSTALRTGYWETQIQFTTTSFSEGSRYRASTVQVGGQELWQSLILTDRR